MPTLVDWIITCYSGQLDWSCPGLCQIVHARLAQRGKNSTQLCFLASVTSLHVSYSWTRGSGQAPRRRNAGAEARHGVRGEDGAHSMISRRPRSSASPASIRRRAYVIAWGLGSGLAFTHCPPDSAEASDHLPRPDVGFQDLTPNRPRGVTPPACRGSPPRSPSGREAPRPRAAARRAPARRDCRGGAGPS